LLGDSALEGDTASEPPPRDCERFCGKNLFECGDCVNNDDEQDGLIDAADPECLGPCDNTEDSLYPNNGVPDNPQCRLDCYFDRNNGNDGCYWSHRCDPRFAVDGGAPGGDNRCSYDPTADVPGTDRTCVQLGAPAGEPDAGQLQACRDYCGPLTPNGCDCFGCCELPADSGQYVFIGSLRDDQGTCNLRTVGDPESCRRCTPVPTCLNKCDPCEICVGRSEPLPSCSAGDAGGGRCPDGVPLCDNGTGACPSKHYCITGCCIEPAE
jgi:hypothetical protein